MTGLTTVFPRISHARARGGRATVPSIPTRVRRSAARATMDPVGMETLLAKLNAAREAMSQGVSSAHAPAHGAAAPRGAKSVDFGALLKQSLDGVDRVQTQATSM